VSEPVTSNRPPAAGQPGYLVRLVPLPDGVPPEVRLRRFLKGALRGYGLRCMKVREDDTATEVRRLQAIIASLADRVAAQRFALSRAAERCGGRRP
jgi:hypothetical protein